MKTSLDCVPCFVRQALEAVRMITPDKSVHERTLRDVLQWASIMDFDDSPPVMAQKIHRRLREITGIDDPYCEIKKHHNRMALKLFPELQDRIKKSGDPLILAARLAIAGNVIDLGVKESISEEDIFKAVSQALEEPFTGDQEKFRRSVSESERILYLADNAGEIVFDRLLIEQLSPGKVTLVVRGRPVINDATLNDAETAGLHRIVKIIDNGSDSPGTSLEDCSKEFPEFFNKADMIIAKGQGNFESLSGRGENIFFLLKAKCPVIADHIGLPVGTQIASCFSNGNLI
jgi:damage-control phosphatase, subfamily I